MEICLNGVWGSVCAERYQWQRDHWDIREARVVCRQLGYDGREFFSGFLIYIIIKNLLCRSIPGLISPLLPYTVILSSLYVLDDVECRGDENILTECERRIISRSYCYRRAEVICNSKLSIP